MYVCRLSFSVGTKELYLTIYYGSGKFCDDLGNHKTIVKLKDSFKGTHDSLKTAIATKDIP